MKALVFNGEVVQISDVEFDVHSSLTWMDAPDGCEVRWELSDGVLVPPSWSFDAAEAIRSKRNALLAATDWWVLPDRTVTQEQLDYRQALRDITAQEGFPENVAWPVKP